MGLVGRDIKRRCVPYGSSVRPRESAERYHRESPLALVSPLYLQRYGNVLEHYEWPRAFLQRALARYNENALLSGERERWKPRVTYTARMHRKGICPIKSGVALRARNGAR